MGILCDVTEFSYESPGISLKIYFARTIFILPNGRYTRRAKASVGVPGRGGFNLPVIVFNPPSCASFPVLGVRNTPPPRSQLQTLIRHHIPQVIEPCHCCQPYVPYPQSAKDASCSCIAFSQTTFWASVDFSCIKYQCIANLNR